MPPKQRTRDLDHRRIEAMRYLKKALPAVPGASLARVDYVMHMLKLPLLPPFQSDVHPCFNLFCSQYGDLIGVCCAMA